MPLDPHTHLVNQGWSGKGTGLRHGAINRPVVVVQKKTLSGIGKDRDEAFPFWDHVFNVAASAIKVKVYNDSDSEDTEDSNPAVTFQRTSTGIISNRRPTSATPAVYSDTATPSDPSSSGASGSSTPRLSIMAAAKQEAARRNLYSMFFRGPILGTDVLEDMAKMDIAEETVAVTETTVTRAEEVVEAAVKAYKKDKKRKRSESTEAEEKAAKKQRKEKRSRKGKEVARDGNDGDEDVDMKVAEGDAELKKSKTDKKRRKDAEKAEEDQDTAQLAKAEKKRLKAEKKAKKEEKRKLKEERRAVRAVSTEDHPPSPPLAEPSHVLQESQSAKPPLEASAVTTFDERSTRKEKPKDKDRQEGKAKKKRKGQP